MRLDELERNAERRSNARGKAETHYDEKRDVFRGKVGFVSTAAVVLSPYWIIALLRGQFPAAAACTSASGT